jgi:gliding motility-associated-like protein
MRYYILILIHCVVYFLPSLIFAQPTLSIGSASVACNSTTTQTIPVSVKNFTGIGAFQGTISWDPTKLAYVGPITLLAPFTPSGHAFATNDTTFINQGKITFTWYRIGGITVPDGSIPFNLKFNLIGGGNTPISIQTTNTPPTTFRIFDTFASPISGAVATNGMVSATDMQAPTISCPTNFTGTSSTPLVVNNLAPTNVTDNCGTPTVTWTASGATTIAASGTNSNASGSTFNIGTTTVTYSATDAANNVQTCSATIVVNQSPNTSDPVLLTADEINIQCAPIGSIVTVPIRVSDFADVAGLSFNVKWNNAILSMTEMSDIYPGLNLNINPGFFQDTAAGIFHFLDGNSAGWPNIPDNGILFSLKFKVKSIGSSSNIEFIATTTMPIIPLEALDADGDPLLLSIDNGKVSFNDATNPTIVCPASVAQAASMGSTSSTVSSLLATASDNCSVQSVSYIVTGATTASGTTASAAGNYNIGANVVTFTATDAGGNTATCSTNVQISGVSTVLVSVDDFSSACVAVGTIISVPVRVSNFSDVAGLSFNLQWNNAALSLTGISNQYAGLNLNINPGFYQDNAAGIFHFLDGNPNGWPNVPNGGVLFTLDFEVLSAVGSNLTFFSSTVVPLISIEALDANSENLAINVDNGSVTFTDATLPTITCPAGVIQSVDSGFNFASLTGLNASASDNCGTPSVSFVSTGAVSNTGTGASADGNYIQGTTSITFTATDAAGNTATCSTSVQITGINPTVLSVDNVNASCAPLGTIVTVPIRVTNFSQVAGLSFNLNWDETILSMTGLTDIYPGLNPTLYPQFFQDTMMGDFHFLDGNSAGWPNIPDNGVLFSLTFRVLNSSGNANLNFYALNNIPLEALDANGVSLSLTTANGSVSFGDTEVPVLSGCPASFTANTNPNSCDVSVILALPTATDNCGLNGAVTTTHPTIEYGLGVNFIIFTATDLAGNTATCLTIITVEDNTPPALTNCNSSVTVAANPATCDQTVNVPLPTAIDACSNLVSLESNHPSTLYVVGQTTVIFTATDNAMNTATCSTIVNVTETDPPVLTNCPAPITVDAVNNECNQTVILAPPTATDACSGIQSIVSNHPSSNYFSGTTTVIYTATDNLDNTATCSVTVTVVDNVSPQLFNCPQNIEVASAPTQCAKEVTWTAPIATDGCGNTSLTLSSDIASGTIFQIGTTTVNYTVTDNQGNTATCSFTVTVKDTVPPSLVCPGYILTSPQVGNCEIAVTWNEPTATDLCDNTITFTSNYNSGETFQANTITNVVYFGYDDFGNVGTCTFTVDVRDITPPILSACPPSVTINADVLNSTLGCGANHSWVEPTIAGVCSQTGNYLIGNATSGDFFPAGVDTVIYKGFNQNGFFDSCFFTITVVDNAVMAFQNFPVSQIISLPPTKCDTAVTWVAPTFVGSLCTAPVLTSNIANGSVLPIGTHLITYTLTNNAGNQISQSFSIQVVDEVAPVLSNCPSNVTLSTGTGCTVVYTWPTVTATDNCDNLVDILSAYNSGDAFPPGETTVRILAVDDGFNYDTCEFKVFVIGSNMPTITDCPQNQLLIGCEGVPTWVTPSITGFCTTPVLTASHNSGDVFPIGVTLVTYTATTATDTATCSFTVTVNESISPSFACPANITVDVAGRVLSDANNFVQNITHNAECTGVTLNFNNPTANDNCSNLIVSQTSGGLSGTSFTGSSTLVFKATDLAGNTAICNVNVTVVDLPTVTAVISKEFACEGDEITIKVEPDAGAGATYMWTGPNQDYGNLSAINVFASEGNAGEYSVFATINGCETPSVTTNLTLASTPVAVDDYAFKVKAGDVLDNMLVLENDNLFNGDVILSLVGTPVGVSLDGENALAYAGSTNPMQVNFLYQICSKACNTLCDQAQVTITVQDTRCVFIPNIITPNGDGINDWFDIPCIETGEYPENELTIYNQWGDKVFYASPYISNPTFAWKGTLNNEDGKDLPDGVYYFIFKPTPTGTPFKTFIEIYR